MRDKFMFFDNFKETAEKLPDDLRLKFYDAMTDYVFKGIEPDDVIISALITAIKPSLDKEDKRGGLRQGAGAPKNNQNASKDENETIKNNQNNQKQSKQSILSETETETENNTKSSDKSSDLVVKTNFDLRPLNDVFSLYGLPNVQKLTDERKVKLKERCKEVGGFENFISEVKKALERSSFLRGDNNHAWRANFDFFLQKSSWQKLLEGSYNDAEVVDISAHRKTDDTESERMSAIIEATKRRNEERVKAKFGV